MDCTFAKLRTELKKVFRKRPYYLDQSVIVVDGQETNQFVISDGVAVLDLTGIKDAERIALSMELEDVAEVKRSHNYEQLKHRQFVNDAALVHETDFFYRSVDKGRETTLQFFLGEDCVTALDVKYVALCKTIYGYVRFHYPGGELPVQVFVGDALQAMVAPFKVSAIGKGFDELTRLHEQIQVLRSSAKAAAS